MAVVVRSANVSVCVMTWRARMAFGVCMGLGIDVDIDMGVVTDVAIIVVGVFDTPFHRRYELRFLAGYSRGSLSIYRMRNGRRKGTVGTPFISQCPRLIMYVWRVFPSRPYIDRGHYGVGL